MKTEEDEAFEELERRQGGGFPAKRAMAADKLHWSDCAIHNGPAYPAGPCDCGVAQGPVAHLWECLGRWSAYLVANGKQADCAPPSWLVEAIRNATAPQPAQEQQQPLTDEQITKIIYPDLRPKYDNESDYRQLVRAVEIAHGIGDKE
jgi:hypothetical protein